MLQGQPEQKIRDFKVVCAWCGVVIRRNSTKDSQGMCQECYAGMLRDYIYPSASQERLPRCASER
ncbi:MAG TPA: hypothetical protein VGB73_17500 [Pyrinomonadaceae bacterium]|jgi:hypothetical protein